MNDNHVIQRLNHLIAICRDCEDEFREAAELVTISDLKELFAMISAQRAAFVKELQALVTAAGDVPARSKDLPGVVRLLTMELRAALSRNHAYGILAECERAENAALDAYVEVLGAESFTAGMREVTQRQFDFIRLSLQRIMHLREISEPSPAPSRQVAGGTAAAA